MKYSVIIPTLNAEKHIGDCVKSIHMFLPQFEIIVSDGGSSDHTVSLLKNKNVIVISAPKGRGSQLNEGAKRATGDILFFLHADTKIAKGAFPVLASQFQKEEVLLGKFSLKFDHAHWLLSCYAQIAKIDSVWTSFGDQGIVVKKTFFKAIGGFPDLPLFEDVAFFDKARRRTKVYTLPAHIITSAEKFIKNGIVKQQLFNSRLVIRYLLGVSPVKLAAEYEKHGK